MKKGISPLVSAVLIIALVIVLATSVMLWGADFIKGLQKRAEEESLKSITCSSDVGFSVKHSCIQGEIGAKVLVENYGTIDIESFNMRIYGDEGTDSGKVPQKIESMAIKLLTMSYDASTTGTVDKIELMPSILYKGELVTCSNMIQRETTFSGCSLSDLQLLACETADTQGTCNKLGEIGLVTEEECQADGFC